MGAHFLKGIFGKGSEETGGQQGRRGTPSGKHDSDTQTR